MWYNHILYDFAYVTFSKSQSLWSGRQLSDDNGFTSYRMEEPEGDY